jgi:hypothetical protein
LLALLNAEPKKNPERDYPEILVEEIEEMITCLEKAAKKKARFRLLLA